MVICLGRGADLHMALLMPLPLTVSCCRESRLVLPFWYRLTRVVPGKGLLTVVVVVVLAHFSGALSVTTPPCVFLTLSPPSPHSGRFIRLANSTAAGMKYRTKLVNEPERSCSRCRWRHRHWRRDRTALRPPGLLYYTHTHTHTGK